MPDADFKNSRFTILVAVTLLPILLLVPLALANDRIGLLSGFLILAFLFFFGGYAFLALLRISHGPLRLFLSPVFGIVTLVTAFDVSARLSIEVPFLYVAAVFSLIGVVLFVRSLKQIAAPGFWKPEDLHAILAGCLVTLAVAFLYWRSGRFSGADFVFYGPAGQDPLFHVTLLQRLLHHVPADNFIVSGLRAPIYHYFDDLTLAFLLSAQHALHFPRTDVFDLYYRCYPTLLYFLLGVLAYRVGRQLLGRAIGGVLSTLVLLGAGGVGWLLGALQTASHASHLAALRAGLFSEWTSWNGVDVILPLVHRPAHYHSLLICLAAITLLFQFQRSRRDWIAAGLLLGLMAGFNFTLAATFGISAVGGVILLWLQRRKDDSLDLAWLACFVLIGSLPVVASMLLSGFHSQSPGFPFRGPNLEFTTELWGPFLRRMLPGVLIPLAALLLFPILAYGVRLFGVTRMMRADLGEPRHRSLATLLAIVFVLSFVIGVFFPFKGLGGVAVIFIQPTLWILGLFSLVPLMAWLGRAKGAFWPVALWAVLAIAWVQTLGAYNLGRKAVFSRETVNVLREIHSSAPADDVVAYVPNGLTEVPVLGRQTETTSFSTTAFTGLDGYVSNESYSTAFAVPGLHGHDDADVLAQAEQIYRQRRDDVQSFLTGSITEAARGRFTKDHVCWIAASDSALKDVSPALAPWRKTPDMALFKLCSY